MDRERPPLSTWAIEQRKAKGYRNTEALADAIHERLGLQINPATLRQFESGRRPPSKAIAEQLERFYEAPSPARDEPAMPAWAQDLVRRLDEPPPWAQMLMGQVLRNEAMLLLLQRRNKISDEEWNEAVEELRRREDLWAGIEEVLGPLRSLRVAAPGAGGNASDHSDSDNERGADAPRRQRSAQ
jgi:hypothetical protein